MDTTICTTQELNEIQADFNRLWHDFLNNGFGNWTSERDQIRWGGSSVDDARLNLHSFLKANAEALGLNPRSFNWLAADRAPLAANWLRPIRGKWHMSRREQRTIMQQRVHEFNKLQGRIHHLGATVGFQNWNGWGIRWAIEQVA